VCVCVCVFLSFPLG